MIPIAHAGSLPVFRADVEPALTSPMRTERFATIRLPSSPANVRQMLGRKGEVWGAESGVDKLVRVRHR